MWFHVNKKLLFDEVKGARDLIQKGVVISKNQGTVFVHNLNHELLATQTVYRAPYPLR